MKTMLVMALALVSAPLAAQEVWRCGPEGRAFQATPCAGGREVPLKPPPGAEAVAQAQAVRARERLALQTLAAERLAREREALQRGLGPGGIEPAASAPPRKAPPLRPLRWRLPPAA